MNILKGCDSNFEIKCSKGTRIAVKNNNNNDQQFIRHEIEKYLPQN